MPNGIPRGGDSNLTDTEENGLAAQQAAGTDSRRLGRSRVSLKDIRDAVAGRGEVISRFEAMSLLVAADFPNGHSDLAAVLEDENDDPAIRVAAASKLAAIGSLAAAELLGESCRHIRDERVLAVVATALGQIGQASALEPLSGLVSRNSGLAGTRAAFAAALISCRLGVPGWDLDTPNESDFLELEEVAASPMLFRRTGSAETELCLQSLRRQPYGVEFSERASYEIRCGHRRWLMLLSRPLTEAGATAALAEKKAMLGVVAAKSPETGSYGIRLLLLAKPLTRPRSAFILVHRPYGRLVLAGPVGLRGDRAIFSLRAMDNHGAIPVRLEGTLERGEISIGTGMFGRSLHGREQPSANSASTE